jgi:hypothetical protein
MSKVSVIEIDNINAPSAATSLNTNFTRLQEAIETQLSRTGTAPNFMDSVLDMNGYNIINVGTITTSDGSGSTGSTYGLLYDGTDQSEALQTVLDAAGESAAVYGHQVIKLTSNDGPLYINARIKVPSNVTLDTSSIYVNLGADGELSIFGEYEELPEENLFRLADDAEPGDTTITIDASDYGSHTLLVADAFCVLRGENDINGNAIQRHEFRIVSKNDSGGISSLVLTIDPPIPDDQGTFTPVNEGSAWEPGETGIDRSLVTVRTTSLLAGNVDRGDLSFDVADGSVFTAGSVAMLQDDRLASDPGTPDDGQPIRQEMVRIRSISTNTITLENTLSRDFLTSENAVLIKIIPVENAHIIGGPIELIEAASVSPASRKHTTLMYFADRCSISGIILDEDAHTYSIRGQAVRATRSMECDIFDNTRIGPKNTSSGDGVGIGNFYSTNTRMWGNYTERCRHGMQNQGSTRANRHNNIGVNNLINTLDDHGVYETDTWDHDNRMVGGGSLAFGSTQQLGATYGNTRWLSGSHFAVCKDNVFVGFADGSNGGIAVRQASGDVLISGNKFAACTTGVRILRDSRGGQTVTTDVVVRDNHFRDCTTNVSADGGLDDWAVDVTYSGTAARPVSILASNGREYSTDTTKLGGSEPSHTDSGETDDWTDLGEAINGINGLRVYHNDAGSGADSIDTVTITGLVVVDIESPEPPTYPEGTSVVRIRDSNGDAVQVGDASDGTIIIDDEIRAVAKLGDTVSDDIAVTASRLLAISDIDVEMVTDEDEPTHFVQRRLVCLADPVSTEIALTIAPTAGATREWSILVIVDPDQTGAVTIALTGAGTINGVAGSDPWTLYVNRPTPVLIRNPTGTAPIVTLGGTVEDGKLTIVSSVSGTLTMRAHNANILLATGDVTLISEVGMNGVVVAIGGAWDVSYGTDTITVPENAMLPYTILTADLWLRPPNPIENAVGDGS